jgi:PIN domain nuclease of toxin-antitoxin system
VAIKHRLGKLPVNPAEFRDQSLAAGASLLPVLDGHVIETANLPLVHGDPIDRLLMAQARLEGLMAVSSDGQMGAVRGVAAPRLSARFYSIRRCWRSTLMD